MKVFSLASIVVAMGLSSSVFAGIPEFQPAPAPLAYSIELNYDSRFKDLEIEYTTVEMTSDICRYEEKNLVVTPVLSDVFAPSTLGEVRFETVLPSNGICLTALGFSGGKLTIKNFRGNPHELVINGQSYGYITLHSDGQSVELLPTIVDVLK